MVVEVSRITRLMFRKKPLLINLRAEWHDVITDLIGCTIRPPQVSLPVREQRYGTQYTPDDQ
jgi:hypothetical protein